MVSVLYKVTPQNPYAHLFQVSCHINLPSPQTLQFSLPTWVPGSYLIREFAKNIVSLQAESFGNPLLLRKINKNTWECSEPIQNCQLTYDIYAFDTSIRAAYLDQFLGFFNGTSLFVRIHGQEASRLEVELDLASHPLTANWEVATTLSSSQNGLYYARSYDELVDHPILMGELLRYPFQVKQVPHEIVFDRPLKDIHLKRIAHDLEKVCSQHIELFENKPPFDKYLFLIRLEEDGYGGLEHSNSSALICKPNDFPKINEPSTSEAYRSFLGLCSHEYFHAWNVKRIRPSSFIPFNYNKENYTSLLWVFEGITSYYDDLGLVRSKVISSKSYLELLSKTFTRVMQTPGRFQQSLAESSYDTWIKFYRPDENSVNSQISYYLKGSLVALALDLTLRIQTQGQCSLDTIMKVLWEKIGINQSGLREGQFEETAEKLAQFSLSDFFQKAVYGTEDLDYKSLLLNAGIEMYQQGEHEKNTSLAAWPSWGARFKKTDNQEIIFQQVFTHGPAMRSGLSASDVLIALDGTRARVSNIDSLLARYRAGDKVLVHASRRDRLFQTEVVFTSEEPNVIELHLVKEMTASQKKILSEWLLL